VYYLHVSQSREAPPKVEPDGETLGVDLGNVNLATDSEGERFTGKLVQLVRKRYHRRRQQLQKCGARNAKRRIRRMGQREARFQKDTNHCISKALVQKAAGARKAIALEDLSGIQARTTVQRAHRYERRSWALFQLRQYIAYKAAQGGIPVRLVDPRKTSQMRSTCGHSEKANRKSQAEFSCQRCGFAAHADYNAALNISSKARASVSRPLASPPRGADASSRLSLGVVDGEVSFPLLVDVWPTEAYRKSSFDGATSIPDRIKRIDFGIVRCSQYLR
jgi:IS605 OrfB family transposase